MALACRASVAATLAWLVASVIPGPAAEYPYYAPLGAVIATSATLRGSVLESLQTVAGIVVGAVIALGVSAVMPSTWLTVSVVVLIGALVAGWKRLGSGSSWVPTAALFVLIVGGGDPVGYVLGYAGLTLLGAVIGMTVNAAVPPLPLAPSQVRLKRLRDALADQLDALADGLAQPEPPSAQEWAERGRSVQPLLEDMRRVVGQTTEARRGNRRVQRHQQAADDQYDQAKALERLTFAVQDMTQLLEDSERRENERTALGPELRPPTAEALAQLAGVLRSTAVATADADDARSAEAALDRLVDAVRRARSSTDDDLFAAASVIISLRRSLEVVVPGGLARGHAPTPRV